MSEHTTALPDGRRLHATYEGDTVGWVVHLEGNEDQPVAGRVLTDVLYDLLDLTVESEPPWLKDVMREISGRDTALGRRFACPCCGFLTFAEPVGGTYSICKACFWEDDGVQLRDPDYEGGANKVSLHQARENFRRHRVSEPRFRDQVRAPLPEEQP